MVSPSCNRVMVLISAAECVLLNSALNLQTGRGHPRIYIKGDSPDAKQQRYASHSCQEYMAQQCWLRSFTAQRVERYSSRSSIR